MTDKKEGDNTSQTGENPPATSPPATSPPATSPPATSPPEVKLLPENRFLFYNSLKLKFTVEFARTPIRLGDDLEATFKIESESEAPGEKPSLKIDKSFQVVILDETDKTKTPPTSFSYFKPENKPMTFVEPAKPADWQPYKNADGTSQTTTKWYVETTKTLTPNIDEITKNKYLPKYPITFALTRSTGVLSESGDMIFKQLAKCCKTVAILPPKITMTRKRRRLPRKGEQFDLTFNLECTGSSKEPPIIPLILKGYFGKDSDPDFVAIGAESETNNNSPTGYYYKEIDIKVNGPAKKTFTLIAKRASFLGYYGIANFKLEVRKWKTISEWRENMTILPNLLDTFIAGATTLIGIGYLYRPDWFPFIADIPILNIANLEAIPAIVYLGYRAMNWAKSNTSKATSTKGASE